MLTWLHRRRRASSARTALIEADAVDLISRFSEQAYFVARDRHREERSGGTVDINRPVGHWSAVKIRVAELSGKEVGVDTSMRFLRD